MSTVLEDTEFDEFTPQLRDEVLVRHYDNEAVVWSPQGAAAAYLDPLASMVCQIIDGQASIADLASDIHEVVGVPTGIAHNQLRRVINTFDNAGLLTTSPNFLPSADFDLFSGPPNP